MNPALEWEWAQPDSEPGYWLESNLHSGVLRVREANLYGSPPTPVAIPHRGDTTGT